MSVFRPDLFRNSVGIVTGGGTGIGRAITYELLTLGGYFHNIHTCYVKIRASLQGNVLLITPI